VPRRRLLLFLLLRGLLLGDGQRNLPQPQARLGMGRQTEVEEALRWPGREFLASDLALRELVS